jgi:hypothetical protein
MKRFTGILAAAAIAIAPMSASALEALTDNAMNDVTAQAGVSIAVDDIVIYQNSIADTTYTDSDEGLGIKIDYAADTHKLTILNAITGFDEDGTTLSTNYTTGYFNDIFGSTATPANPNTKYADNTVGMVQTTGTGAGEFPTGYQTGAAALSIDVGTCNVLTAGKNFNGMQLDAGLGGMTGVVGGVVIGLPTLEITTYRSNDTKTISMVSNGTAPTNGDVFVNANKEYITITKDGYSKMAILGGTIEIAPH